MSTLHLARTCSPLMRSLRFLRASSNSAIFFTSSSRASRCSYRYSALSRLKRSELNFFCSSLPLFQFRDLVLEEGLCLFEFLDHLLHLQHVVLFDRLKLLLVSGRQLLFELCQAALKDAPVQGDEWQFPFECLLDLFHFRAKLLNAVLARNQLSTQQKHFLLHLALFRLQIISDYES